MAAALLFTALLALTVTVRSEQDCFIPSTIPDILKTATVTCAEQLALSDEEPQCMSKCLMEVMDMMSDQGLPDPIKLASALASALDESVYHDVLQEAFSSCLEEESGSEEEDPCDRVTRVVDCAGPKVADRCTG